MKEILSIPIIIEECDDISRLNEYISFGMPLSKGIVHNTKHIAIFNELNERIPSQCEILERWSDGSVKWLLLDFQANIKPKETIEYKLKSYAEPISEVPGCYISVRQSPEAMVIDTGYALFFLNHTILKPFERIMVQGCSVLAEAGSSFILTDAAGREYEPHIHTLAVETAGCLRTTLKIDGRFAVEQQAALAHFVCRLSFYAGSGLVEAKCTLHNPHAAQHIGGLWDLGDEGSVYFRDLTMQVALLASDNATLEWTTQPHQPLGPSCGEHVQIYQDSSGGRNWCSTNHVNRFGKVMQTFQGYRVTVGDSVVEEGKRATPSVAVSDDEKRIVVGIDKFWQNFPKALEGHNNRLSIRLFPRQYRDVYELQGGEQKTHTIFLQFDGPQGRSFNAGWFHARLRARTTPQWYTNSQAFSYLTPCSEDKHSDCQALIETAIEGRNTFFERREIIDEYGWRHFGDLYADHETVGHQGDTPLVSHYNNQYDVIYGAIVQYVRGGDPRWLHLMADLARHVIDIDIYHTSEDRPSYNGGMFWHTDHYTDAASATHRTYSKTALRASSPQSYGGGPSNEHNYTTGLLHYYFLTGDQTARQAVLDLAEWVVNMDGASRRFLGRFDHRPTGMSSATANWDYHGPGRGAGNSINALLDASVLSEAPHYLAKAEELLRRCIHPKDDIERRDLRDVEYRWSYTVFLQALGKYLDVKAERGQIDYMYSYARDSLLHYAAWMLEHEVPYKLVLDRVKIPTETWPAQDIRKSNVFKWAAKYAAHDDLRQVYLRKSENFFQACITDVLSFTTCTFTRPLVLLMTNGFMQAYFDQHPEETAPVPGAAYDFGKPEDFTPQFYELRKGREKLNLMVHWVRAAGRRLSGTRRDRSLRLGEDHG